MVLRTSMVNVSHETRPRPRTTKQGHFFVSTTRRMISFHAHAHIHDGLSRSTGANKEDERNSGNEARSEDPQQARQ